MYILNVTFFVHEGIEEDWLVWSKANFSDMTGENAYFNKFKLMRVISHSEPDQVTYSCQLYTDKVHNIQLFEIELEPGLLADNSEKFGDKSVFFKSLLQEIK